MDNAPPVVSITAPVAGQVLRADTDFTVTWTASDVYFADDPIKIEFSSDDGANYSTLVAAMANTGSFLWAVPEEESTECLIRITATDALGGATGVTPVESGRFTITWAPVIASVADPDLVHEGIDGRDFKVDWSPSSNDGVTSQEIYILPRPSVLDFGSHAAVKTLPGNAATTWTGDDTVTKDSAGAGFDPAKSYDIYVVAVDGGSRATSAPGVWSATAPAAPVVTGAADPDSAVAGVTGEDFQATWTHSTSADVIRQEIYILPSEVSLTLTGSSPTNRSRRSRAIRADMDRHPGLTLDSAGDLLAADDYKIYVVAVSDDLRRRASTGASLTTTAP